MNDLIDRQAVIDAFWKLDVELRISAIEAVLDMFKSVPSAQPEIVRCKDCKWWKNQDGSTGRFPCINDIEELPSAEEE